jgi:hypothetical protein
VIHLREISVSLALSALLLLPAGCRQKPDEVVPETTATAAVETTNEELGITLQSIPEGMVVEVNQGANLILAPKPHEHGVLLKIEVGPHEVGVNLVAAVKDHQEHIEDFPGGKYFGSTELISHLGTAFLSRGQFRSDMDEIEEARLFVIHPAGDRLLSLIYTYPAGDDSNGRAETLLALLDAIR